MRRALGLLVMAVLSVILLYASPWWPWREICLGGEPAILCARDGVFGVGALHPRGDVIARWLRGTAFSEAALLVWVVAAALTLTGAQMLWDRLSSSD